MVEGQVSPAKLLAAVLTRKLIPKENIGPRKADNILAFIKRNEGQEAQNNGNFDRESDRTNLFVGFLDNLYLALKEQLNGLLPSDKVNGFKTSIEDESVPHSKILRGLTEKINNTDLINSSAELGGTPGFPQPVAFAEVMGFSLTSRCGKLFAKR